MIEQLPDDNIIATSANGTATLTFVLADDRRHVMTVLLFRDPFGSNYRIALDPTDLAALDRCLASIKAIEGEQWNDILRELGGAR